MYHSFYNCTLSQRSRGIPVKIITYSFFACVFVIQKKNKKLKNRQKLPKLIPNMHDTCITNSSVK